jgi:hypothetical protein
MHAFRHQAFVCVFGICAATIGFAGRFEPASALSLREVLSRAGAYSVSYGDALASVIADEEFIQQLVSRRDQAVLEQRRLQSEIAFVKLADTIEWLAFRSVLRVDGAAVRGAAGQLERVFRETPRSALAQARAIADESARYNLGLVHRNFNVPTTVLQFILPQYQDRFRYRKVAQERAAGEAEPIWIVEFREQPRGTFIRTPDGRSAPAEGRLWISPADGRVVRSRMAVTADVKAEIEVEWRHDARLALWVPSEMREAYSGREMSMPRDGRADEPYQVRGVATYSNYRRFEVDSRIVR